ncbi:putative leucine-rich repeat-containing, plant-type, leucine-rich repeat domain superfamily [Helianthus annuus]|uniref:Leucine-rich repeat-containing, plant-type, leucine-rich repeat domain superfamily n=1 Tax=Helianthus annuus TaxID=4232 RepID=A0A251SM08_HELAN|nr:receptor-like protein Cf-9 homolog [Helianthus annuus]KAF5771119.1 putative leucine-rich repeat-containing, plant-type, leucine-rich repeat domain superfamily [Helianthus annuus]KAJ0470931.1 putative leucine-rich repeat-containing, plant-type, leucine-rich repeat domain superfamily [Helianthus annuus]KAJ0661676.1 putative leucine-rich repeat-containing, plant-type, leucine-rich repeat domain superfamily [Helianthus annuus]KAJ0842298.1 putative leucine-rich repeat-containing, plant-type, leuc
MSNSILLFFFLSLFFISSFTSSINTTHKCSVQQTLDLLHFKQNISSINDTMYRYDFQCEAWLGSSYNPIMMSWNTRTDCCEWNGVTCDDSTGDVIGLDLSCGMLQGTIHPNTTLFHLPRLQRLNLAYNNFTDSEFPPAIGRLSNSLTHLNISSCEFTGQVPTTISHLHKLVSLDLSSNGDDFNLEPHVFINLLQNLSVVKELSLTYVNISAVLPSNLSISSALKLLNLGSAGLQGNLPRNIFNLQSLETLDLSSNSLTGHIPSEVSLLPNLVSLDLYGNNGIDLDPHIFSSLLINSTFLRDLHLYGVNIGFVLPTYLNISSSLRSLDLSNTSLQGKLPDNILNLKYLEQIELSGNNIFSGPFPKVNTSTNIPLRRLGLSGCGLNGSLPKSLGNLRYLEDIDLSNNKLSGTLPSSLFTLPSLEFINLNKNMFQGNMPLELFSLQSLEFLSLAKNQLTGLIDVLDNGPDLQTFQRLTNLIILDLSYNNFRGDWNLDALLSSLTNLAILDLSYNNFRGDWELDALLSSLTNLQVLTLSHSGISVTTSNANHHVNPNFGTLSLASCSLKVFPVSIRAMTNLRYLNLSNNDIHGHIPDWIGEIGRNELLVLDLSNNSITGTIPNVYEDWSELEGFVLNGNQLQGNVPTSLYNCQNLRIIDLGNNQLSDTFPGWLGDLPKLQVLILRSNNFHGGINVTSSKLKFPFPSLQVIDLSHNGFVGQLPTKYLQNFNAMKNVVKKNTKPEYVSTGSIYYSIIVTVKGVDQYFPQLSVQYTIVDLSGNKFEGEIPNIIGNLKSLIVLNLSHNSLTGQIPHSLGNISEIESLDLSWNQLTGEIPQSLVDLTFLEFLNLSQNHLVGHVPQGKQFDTFDNYSFGGNPKLCGPPLTKKCGEHPHELQLEGDGDGEESGFTWKVVVMGYGCGTLLGMVLGYIMLSTGRPKWFNAIANVANHMILNRQNKRR